MEAAEARYDAASDQIVAGRYLLVSLCGKGGMGAVWRARNLADDGECAIKILHHTAPDRIPRLAERFVREAKVASSIASPHAVRVLDYGVDQGRPFIAMELLEGETLAAKLRRSGRMTALETFTIVDHVAKALACAHAMGVVHRDLKPDNIFLSRSNDGSFVAKVLDFGIAKILEEETISRDLTETGALLGTPHYMSPEQIDGARYVDHRTDLWSLSVIAFECITGQRPFQGDGLRGLVLAICVRERPSASSLCDVPADFDTWFAKGTSQDPAKRFRTAAELAEELGKVCHGTVTEPEGAEPWVGTDAATSPIRRSWLRSSWGVVAFLLLAFFAWLSVRSVTSTPALNDDSLTLPRVSRATEPTAPLPVVSAPIETAAREATAFDHSVPKPETPKPETPRPSVAPTRRARLPSEPQPAPSSAPESPSAAPPAGPAPSAKPAQWDFAEMLKDRK